MGRRPSIVGSISKIVQSVGVYERRKERERTVQSAISNGGPKEKAPVFNLLSVDFDKETRNTKIEFRQTTEYRTVERYVQQNYVKYPVYSGWKIRTKNITKTIKLTDANLESLNNNPDFLLREFATGIIDRIDDEDFYPSWYVINYLRLDEKQKIENLTSQKTTSEGENKKQKNNLGNYYSNFNLDLNNINSIKKKEIKLRDKYSKIVNKIQASKKPLILKIVSLGIYAYLVSSKRLRKYQFKLNSKNSLISEMDVFEQEYPKLKEIASAHQKSWDELLKMENNKFDALIRKEKEKTSMLINEVVPLTAVLDEE